MKRLLSILLFIPIVGFSQYTAIPDQNFEQALIDEGYDDVIDGQVLTANINSVISLDISNQNIQSLLGIEDFISLNYLDCSNNQLNNLDISQNSNLESLWCRANQFTNLDVSNNIELTRIVCDYNQLTSLDVSNNTKLEDLSCSDNQLTSLDISNNIALTGLHCYFNQLTNLDLTNNTELTDLWCYNNQLTSLDLSNCTKLNEVDCEDNLLTCLNMKNVSNTNFMFANNFFYTQNNPNLTCIELDYPAWATTNWTTADENIDSFTTFSTNCNYPAGCFTNSIEEYQSNLSIFPNPTNNLIQIEIEDYNGTFEAELFDFTGKLLETTNNSSISLADYPTGIYLLKVAYGDSVEQLKVVKE